MWYFLEVERHTRDQLLLRFLAYKGMFFHAQRLLVPQRRSVRDGQQRDASVFSSLENLSLHVDAHGAGALIQ